MIRRHGIRLFGKKVWHLEDEEYQMYKQQLNKEKVLFQIIEKPYYLTWWVMLDLSRDNIEQYETMARLVCDANLLKASDARLKGAKIAS